MQLSISLELTQPMFPFDVSAPTVTSRTISSDGLQLTLTFSEPVVGFTSASGWVLTPSGGAAGLTYVSGNGTNTVTLSLSRPVLATETATLAYVPGAVQDAAGNAVAAFTGATAVNTSVITAPSFASGAVNPSGNLITITLSQSVTNTSGFTLVSSGGPAILTYVSGAPGNVLVFSVNRVLAQGETISISYSPGTIVGTLGGIPLISFAGSSVTNTSTQVFPSVRAVTTGTTGVLASNVTLPTRATGDTLVAVVAAAANLVAANTGWTRQINQVATDLVTSLAVYTRTSDGTDNTPLGGLLTVGGAWTIFAIQNPKSGYDGSASGAQLATLSINAPSVTPTGPNDVLISAYLRIVGAGSITPPASQTATTQVVQGVPSLIITLRCGYEQLTSSAATGTRIGANSTSVIAAAANILVK